MLAVEEILQGSRKKMTEQVCRKFARDLIRQIKIEGPPTDVEATAKACGLSICYIVKEGNFSGRLKKEQLIIEVNSANHANRQRFTIAHELGYYVLNHNPVRNVAQDDAASDPYRYNEKQANWFAAELLMPKDFLKKQMVTTKDIKALSKIFKVSEEAMFRQIDSYGLI